MPLSSLPAPVPPGTVIGLLGEDESGRQTLLALALEGESGARLLGPLDAAVWGEASLVGLDHTLATKDAITRGQTTVRLHQLRRGQGRALLISNEPDLLVRLCDEVWWIDQGRLRAKGDPGEVTAAFARYAAGRLAAWGASQTPELAARLRKGDGRAEILSIVTRNENDQPAIVWHGGRTAGIRIRVRYHAPVEDPVVGILIRSRVGVDVYGTNSELEKVKLGPCPAGQTLTLDYRFRCELCPGEYTLTVASHDPDGLWHEWMEDAVAFSVVDDRYTAGVANLHASLTISRRE